MQQVGQRHCEHLSLRYLMTYLEISSMPQNASKCLKRQQSSPHYPSLEQSSITIDYLTVVVVSMPSVGTCGAKLWCVQPSQFWDWAGTITLWPPTHPHRTLHKVLQDLFWLHASTRTHPCCDIIPHQHGARITTVWLCILPFLCRCLVQGTLAEVVVVVVVMDICHSHFWVVLVETLEVELIGMDMVVIGNRVASITFQG